MPYTLKTQQISVKDPDSGEYIGVDVLTEQTAEGLIAELQAEGNTQIGRINQAAVDVQSAVDQAETEAQQLISSTQSSLNTLETQKDTIAQTVASMAELGTDTTLTTAGMAADSKATGDEISNVKNAIDALEWTMTNVAPDDTSCVTVSRAVKVDSEYSHDFAVKANAYGGVAVLFTYTLPNDVVFEATDKLFMSADFQVELAGCQSIQNRWLGNNEASIESGFTGEWLNHSLIRQQVNNNNTLYFVFNYPDAATAMDKIIHVRNVVIVNLTETYGAGNEPSLDAMREILSENDGYIDSINLFKPKEISLNVDELLDDASDLSSNTMIDAINYFRDNSSRPNDGTSSVTNPSGITVSMQPIVAADVGDIIYVYGEFKPYSAGDNCASIVVRPIGKADTDEKTSDISTPLNDHWYSMSARMEVTSASGGNSVQFYATWNSSASIAMYYRHVTAINLTKVFGEFCEPPKAVLDNYFEMVSAYNGIDFESRNIKVFNLGCANRKIANPAGNYVVLDDEGNVKMGSVPDANWSGWQEIGTYGQSRVADIPIYNKVHGTLETDGMFSVLPIWGCWSDAASSTGNQHHGGHVFHGWTTDRQHRLTMVQNIYRDDEAAVFNYIPGDKSQTSEGIFLRLRLGADNNYKGVLIENEYGGTNNSEYHLARMTVYGRLNIARHNNYDNIPASANADGVKGDICVDENYIYVCTGTNTWKRVPLQSW